MRRLNRLYRRKDRTTDVLAFPIRQHPARSAPRALRPVPRLLGDVVISLPQAERQAARAGHALDHELTVLVIHGLLHLLGYDHERSARDAARMSRRESLVLRRLGRLPRLAGKGR